MRVAVSLLTLFPGRVGGSEMNVKGLLGAYAAGHGPSDLVVLANRHVMAAYGDIGVPLHHVRSYRAGDRDATRFAAMQLARALPALAARDVPAGIDVVHYPVTVPIPKLDARTVVTVHDVQHHELPHLFSRMEHRLRGWAYDDAARAADRVVTISEHARAGIVRHLGIPAERIDVIGNAVDHERFTPDGPAGLPGLPDRYVLYPANMWPHKNHERLLAAFERVADPSLHLVLTGQTYDRGGLLAGRSRVVHAGYVPSGDLPALVRGARAMVFPSLFEGFGLPPLEAMACGTPVAASDRGAIGEICGDAALLFDPEDGEAIAGAIRRIVEDEPLRDRLRERGLKRSREFRWDDAARRHVEVYRRAAGLGEASGTRGRSAGS